MDFIERGNPVVPLEKRGGVTRQLNGAVIKFPYRVQDRMVVGIEDEAFKF